MIELALFTALAGIFAWVWHQGRDLERRGRQAEDEAQQAGAPEGGTAAPRDDR